ncbi:MAG: hypothetical protein K1V96_01165 [Lachnospiraceae bacterium]
MKIAFWSEEKKVGTTFNMSVIACASVLMYPISIAVISGSYHDEDLERNFLGGKKNSILRPLSKIKNEELENFILIAEQQEYYITSGLDYLLYKTQQENLTEQVIKENMRQVIENRMYCLPTSNLKEQEWWRRDKFFIRMEQVVKAIENCFDVVFIDCGSRKDDFAQKMLQEAEVCVLNMEQRAELIGDYYRNSHKFRGKTFFLVGKYFKDALYTRKNLERIYRIEEDMLGAIPYNAQMQDAGRVGKIENRIKDYIGNDIKGKSIEFEKELIRSTRLILKQAGIII